MKKLFSFIPKDASGFEKVVYVIVVAIMSIVVIWGTGSVWQIFNNDLSRAAHTGRPLDAVLGTATFILAALVLYSGIKDWQLGEHFTVRPSLRWGIILLLIGLSWLLYCGFMAGAYK
jgi:hypothetical protein